MMKLIKGLLLTLAICLISYGSHAETQIIESKATLIINGQKISSPFEVVLLKDQITVNGVEFPLGDRFYVEVDSMPVDIKPSINDEGYIDWLVKTAIQKNNKMLNEGRSEIEIWEYIDSFLKDNTDSLIIVVHGDKGHYFIEKRDSKVPIMFSLPSKLASPALPTREEMIKSRYNNLCTYLRNDMYIENEKGRFKASSLPKGQ